MSRFGPIALVLGVILFPCIAACTGIGFGFRAKAALVHGEVTAETLADRAALPGDTFVTVSGSFEPKHESVFPIDDTWYIKDDGGAIYRLSRVPDVIVYCKDADCAPLRAAAGRETKVEGRICEHDDSFFGCRLASPLSSYVREEKKRRGSVRGEALRVFVVGETVASTRAQAWLGFGIAGALSALYVGLVLLVGLRKRASPPLHLEAALSVPLPVDEVRRRLEQGLSAYDDARIEKSDASALVVVQGYPEGKARLLGMTSPAHVPRRVSVTWESRPYHPTLVRVRIEDRAHWLPANALVSPLLRAALDRTHHQLTTLLGL